MDDYTQDIITALEIAIAAVDASNISTAAKGEARRLISKALSAHHACRSAMLWMRQGEAPGYRAAVYDALVSGWGGELPSTLHKI